MNSFYRTALSTTHQSSTHPCLPFIYSVTRYSPPVITLLHHFPPLTTLLPTPIDHSTTQHHSLSSTTHHSTTLHRSLLSATPELILVDHSTTYSYPPFTIPPLSAIHYSTLTLSTTPPLTLLLRPPYPHSPSLATLYQSPTSTTHPLLATPPLSAARLAPGAGHPPRERERERNNCAGGECVALARSISP